VKILLVASGKSFHATRWANSLANRGHEVLFYSIGTITRPLSEKIKKYSFSDSYSKLNYIYSSLQLRQIIKAESPEILHAHYSSGNGLLAALSLLGIKTPFVTSLYGTEVFDFPKKSFIHKHILGSICNRADVVLSTSQVMANEFCSVFNGVKEPIITPFGVDVDSFKPRVESLDKTNKKLRFGIVKKMEHKYGIDLLIRATKKLIDKYPDSIELVIAGGGGKELELRKLANSLGLEEVSFLGWVDNSSVPDLLRSIDIFVVPSRCFESFGVAAVEAQACGVPCIVSNIGGLPEVVSDGETGLLFEPENTEDLYMKMEHLLVNAKTRYEMGVAARKRALECFNWEKSLDQMEEIYFRFKAS